eukprot:2603289-Rhodomonas_salina.1
MEYPDGQPASLYTSSSISHTDPARAGITVLFPKHRRPGGHRWHSSWSGLIMYCRSEHGLHCWLSWLNVPELVPSVALTIADRRFLALRRFVLRECAGPIGADGAGGTRLADLCRVPPREIVLGVTRATLLRGLAFSSGVGKLRARDAIPHGCTPGLRAESVKRALDAGRRPRSLLERSNRAVRAHLTCVEDAAFLCLHGLLEDEETARAARQDVDSTYRLDLPRRTCDGWQDSIVSKAVKERGAFLALVRVRVDDVLCLCRALQALLSVMAELSCRSSLGRVDKWVQEKTHMICQDRRLLPSGTGCTRKLRRLWTFGTARHHIPHWAVSTYPTDSCACLAAEGIAGAAGAGLRTFNFLVCSCRARQALCALALCAVRDKTVIPSVTDLALLRLQGRVVFAVAWRASHKDQIFSTRLPCGPGSARHRLISQTNQPGRTGFARRQRIGVVLSKATSLAQLIAARVDQLVVFRAVNQAINPVGAFPPTSEDGLPRGAGRRVCCQCTRPVGAPATDWTRLTLKYPVSGLPDVRATVTKTILCIDASVRAGDGPRWTVETQLSSNFITEGSRWARGTCCTADHTLECAWLAGSACLAGVKHALLPSPAHLALLFLCTFVVYSMTVRAADEPVYSLHHDPR